MRLLRVLKAAVFVGQMLAFYTPPYFSDGVLCFHVGRPCVCPFVCPSVHRNVGSTYVRPSTLRFGSIT